MPLVFLTGSERRSFHKSKDCYELGSKTQEVYTAPLSDLPHTASPCKACYPDAPRVRVLRRLCLECSTDGVIRPCEHNGGVQVVVRHAAPTIASGRQAVTYHRKVWVWPDHAHRYS